MRNIAFSLLALLVAVPAFARAPDHQGLVMLKNGHKLHTILYKPQKNAPTVVLLHGLTYTEMPWRKTVDELVRNDFGVVVYDMRGMGKTLEASGPVKKIIPLAQQVEDLELLLNQLGMKRVILAGLSYGGAVGLAFTAAHPERVHQLVVMAPYVKALKAQDDYLQKQVAMHRRMFPQDRRSDDEIYDHYLKALIYQTYPIAEPVVRDHPWRLEAIVHMVRGVRKFKAADLVRALPEGRIHMVVAGRDQYVPMADLNEFWDALSPRQKLSRIVVKDSEHKLPEAVPHFLAGWLSLVAQGDKRLRGDFLGLPDQGTAASSQGRITGLPRN